MVEKKICIKLLARNYFGKITLHNFFMHLVPLKGNFPNSLSL